MNGITATFSGLVGGEPLVGCTSAGDAMTSFSVAVRDFSTSRPEDQFRWVRVAVFDELATYLADCLHRGDHVTVAGRLSVKVWEGHPAVEVYARAVELLPVPPAPPQGRRPRGETLAV